MHLCGFVVAGGSSLGIFSLLRCSLLPCIRTGAPLLILTVERAAGGSSPSLSAVAGLLALHGFNSPTCVVAPVSGGRCTVEGRATQQARDFFLFSPSSGQSPTRLLSKLRHSQQNVVSVISLYFFFFFQKEPLILQREER